MSEVAATKYPVTNDGRYFVVRGRLWRRSDPAISPARREELVGKLMKARRQLGNRLFNPLRALARQDVDEAKRALGERGPVWWKDGTPDYNRRMVKNTPYASWYRSLNSDEREESAD